MTEEYREFGREDFRSPEHWEDHGFDDDCSTAQGVRVPHSFRGEIQAEPRARKALKDFLKIAGATPLKRFGPGEEFTGLAYEDGTIIGFDSESLSPGDDPVRKWDYSKPKDYWGVVASYKHGNDVRKVLVSYPRSETMTSARNIYPGLAMEPSLIVGVTHERIQWDNEVYQRLVRHGNVSLYAFGEAVPSQQNAPSRLGILRRALMPGNGAVSHEV